MKIVTQQLLFDGQRQLKRNLPFLFFSILMPAGFYILFTRVMSDTPSTPQFAKRYLTSMIVYSGLISANFGLAIMLLRDRKTGYQARLRLTPSGLGPYRITMTTLFLLITGLTVGVLGGLAVVLNQVTLTAVQWAALVLVAGLGEVPLLLIGYGLSRLNRVETLNLASNLLTFPGAILTGLWWPFAMLPHWAQGVGRLLPPYFTKRLLDAIVLAQPFAWQHWIGLLSWLLGLGAVGYGQRYLKKMRLTWHRSNSNGLNE